MLIEENAMKSDSEIERNVEAELKWDPDIDATDIAVSVKDGVVHLAGFVRSYAQKRHAEKDAKRVAGVVGVANDIEVRLPIIHRRPDPKIARDVIAAIRSELPYVAEKIKVTVQDGWVTLEGELEWHFQRERAEEAAYRPKGVKGVTNNIHLGPRLAAPEDIKIKIEEALKRSATIDASRISVETKGGKVILKGTVRSWVEREEAERSAWAAPGVIEVDNQITVSSDVFV
jgi:osmotically-inducible protein OsmY